MNNSFSDIKKLRQIALDWYHGRNWKPFPFQMEMLEVFLQGESGLLNAPTGSGKTLAVWIPAFLSWMRLQENPFIAKAPRLQVLWITPLRALARDIVAAANEAATELDIPWTIEARTGDTSSSVKARQKRRMPSGLVTTPESMHVLFSGKDHLKLFEEVSVVVVDEWHELLGTKRGVQTELLIARLRQINPGLQVWGISATIGNMAQAMEVLLGNSAADGKRRMVRANIQKQIAIESILPDTIDSLPWAGHLGIHLIDKVLPVLQKNRTTLIFTNTRSQSEIWYQALLEADPNLAGDMAMHHGSISAEIRSWVEDALHEGRLKVVVCTSSLDLGVDFRPVETVIQVGGAKGVARFLQRAGRSGHAPGELSRIYFVPTHSLELIEAVALKEAVKLSVVEERKPVEEPVDVLVQYLLTLACGDGFSPEKVYQEVKSTWSYRNLSKADFDWSMDFITTGGKSLYAYDEYRKVVVDEENLFRIEDKRLIRQHKLSIGTIVSESSMVIKYVRGGKIGTAEESFISQLSPGDNFWFSGRNLELVRVRNMEAQVKRSKKKTGKVPRWMGSRMPLSSQMATLLRKQLDDFLHQKTEEPEIKKLEPLLQLQIRRSAIPHQNECLIESIHSREGHHLFIYPFEGRVVHEILGTLIAWRIAQLAPLTFSIAMNDYGFELLSDKEIPLTEALEEDIFSLNNFLQDITRSVNETEMARRKFREIAAISGLIFKGLPGKNVAGKHLQASASLLFKVFEEHDPHNLLLRQSYDEVLKYQIDMDRLESAMTRLNKKRLLITEPARFTPLSFPIMVDRLREKVSTEKLADRIARMQVLFDD